MSADTERAAVKSAERVLDMLELVARNRRGLSHTQISTALDIPKSSVTHLLRNLSDRGYLHLDSASRLYSLGPAAAALGSQAQASAFRLIAGAFLPALTHETRESSGAYVFDGSDVERIAGHNSDQALLYAMTVPQRFPAYAVSGGKAMLAFLPDAEREAYFAGAAFLPITPQTLTAQGLRDQLPAIRASGFASCIEECTPGIVSIAAPVLGPGGYPLGSIAVSLPRLRHDAMLDAAIRVALAQARDQIETKLGG